MKEEEIKRLEKEDRDRKEKREAENAKKEQTKKDGVQEVTRSIIDEMLPKLTKTSGNQNKGT